jgi:Zn-dependent protease
VSAVRVRGIEFYPAEIRDLLVAWGALGVAFSVFVFVATGRSVLPNLLAAVASPLFGRVLLASVLTVGVGFLCHELAHKVVAVRFGQRASFKADYGMLALCLGAAFAGFLFAAPGAVRHRGRVTPGQSGRIAVAGPLTNVALLGVFVPLSVAPGIVGQIGRLGTLVNAFLAAFNMVPFGPLDGRTVLSWNRVVFGVVFAGSALLAVGAFLVVGFPAF